MALADDLQAAPGVDLGLQQVQQSASFLQLLALDEGIGIVRVDSAAARWCRCRKDVRFGNRRLEDVRARRESAQERDQSNGWKEEATHWLLVSARKRAKPSGSSARLLR